MESKLKTVRLKIKLLDDIALLAKRENRTVNNMIETLLIIGIKKLKNP